VSAVLRKGCLKAIPESLVHVINIIEYMLTGYSAKDDAPSALRSATVLVLLRVAHRWNQTGQKFAGADDIAHSWLPQHKTVFWTLILVTYFWNCYALASQGFPHLPRQFRKAGSQMLMLFAATFKLAFTYEDAPELLDNYALWLMGKTAGFTLVARARTVFIALAAAVVQVVVTEYRMPVRRTRFGKHIDPFMEYSTNTHSLDPHPP
jgi:ethanolaminephosphotransferase